MVARCLSPGDKMTRNITFRNLTDKYGASSEQDLSHISVPIAALHFPACTGPKVETVAVLAQKLQDAWLCTKSMGLLPPLEYIWMDAGFFERGLSQRVWK